MPCFLVRPVASLSTRRIPAARPRSQRTLVSPEAGRGQGPLQELLALRPEDISEDGSVIHVEYAVKMVNGVPQLGPPKSVRSRRTIPIPEQFCPYVRYLREHSGTPYV